MEQRQFERKPIVLDLVVSCASVGLFRGKATDASYGGMYVSSNPVTVPLQAQVTVTFHCEESSLPKCFNAQGVVTHQSARGFGIRFERLDKACHTALCSMLNLEAHPQSSVA